MWINNGKKKEKEKEKKKESSAKLVIKKNLLT